MLELPLDYPRPALQTFNGDVVNVSIDASSASRLDAAGRSVGCTLFQCVLGVWCVVLCRHAGQEEVVVGSPYHGRDVGGTEALIGYFVNMLALRLGMPSGASSSSGGEAAKRGARPSTSAASIN